MKEELIGQLQELKQICMRLDHADYNRSVSSLDDQSIGSHVRHIIELVDCLLNQYEQGKINYDLRQRNRLIEQDNKLAVRKLKELINKVHKPDKQLLVCHTNYLEEKLYCQSTYLREILYNTEHCIHHKALIKVALYAFEIEPIDLKTFGLAPSTYNYRKQSDVYSSNS